MRYFHPITKALILLVFMACMAISPRALTQPEPGLSSDVRARIDELARQTLVKTGVPSASISVVKDGRLAYVQAYGNARVDPPVAATPAMRYSIGSISKQFTAAAVLMLAEEGRLSLDDPVSKFVPGLTRGNEVTVRQVLSHTSGYQDYWPHDYVPPFMLKETTAAGILDRWARIPLDFEPGTQWQYSNTNYVIAGLIVEKASGTPLLQFLAQRIFTPLGMKSVADIDRKKLPEADAAGYFRYALGPPRRAPKEAPGWLFAAAELAMTAEDLQKWNIALMRHDLLKPASYQALETEIRLKNGAGTGYALGVSVGSFNGHRAVRHGGEVSGFTSSNVVLPDDGLAVAVLTNQDAADASGRIAQGILGLLLKNDSSAIAPIDPLVRKALEGFARGEIDRSLFTENANAYFSAQALKDYSNSLAPLGAMASVAQINAGNRGGMILRGYTAKFANRTLSISIFQMPDGKIEQFLIRPQD
ncbi:MAG: beta-lactamase family protein [Acidobacteriia bacterium]|nr:beta-lactamase family protein [Terriglobia bacterium]